METQKIALVVWVLSFIACKQERTHTIIFPEDLAVDTIPFASEPTSNLILLEALVKGNPYHLIFDSGSPTTLINSTIPVYKIFSDTVFFHDIQFQQHTSFRVLLDTLNLGGIKVINMDSYIQRNLNMDGMLGVDIIENFAWKFDLINRKMYVTKDVKNFELKGNSIPFKRKGQYIFIECNFDGIVMELIVDTGYGGFISIDKNTIGSAFKLEKEPVFWEGVSTRQMGNPYASPSFSPRIDSTYYLTGKLNVGEIFLENEIIELRNLQLNVIGMDFFKRFDYFILDYPNKMIHFGEEKDKSLNFLISSLMRINTKGVTFIPSSSSAQIGRITAWAKEKGINYLDTVISIDGISVVNRDSTFYQNKSKLNEETNVYEYNPSQFVQLWNDFHFISDTSVIELKRGDSSQKFTLIRQYNFREMPDSLHDYYMDLSLPFPTINRVKTESDTYYFTFKTEELLPWGLRKE